MPVTPENVSEYFNGAAMNIGVQMGPVSSGLADVDLDCLESLRLADHFLPPTNAVFGRFSKPSSHRLYYATDPEPEPVIQLRGLNLEMLVELRLGCGNKGAQTMFPGSIHPDSGEAVEWVSDGEPAIVPCTTLKKAVIGIAVASLLVRHYPAEGGRHQYAQCIGGFLARTGGTSAEEIARFVRIVAQAAGDSEVADRARAARDAADAYAEGDNAYGLTKLREMLGEPVADAIAKIIGYREGTGVAPAFSEEALALEFATRHAGDLRYVAQWGKWYRWDGTRWTEDKTRQIFDLARHVCREAAIRANRAAKTIASAKTRAAVVSLGSEDRRLAATMEQWDTNPWLLNTPGGIVDLRTGAMRPAQPDDYMTMMTAATPGGSCPLWHKFLQTVTGGDTSLQKYLQVASGYSLTGSTREQILLFLYGTGQNGKTVFIQTLSDVLGDYHTTAPMETFVDSVNERHPTDLAGLRGARLVTAAETEQGRRWAESKIKTLTGGDKITARFMRQDFFTYVPQFTLMVYGNHKPGLKSVDDAIRRRIKLIPFAVKIPEADRDKELPEKLKLEWPGILAWMIEGCLMWQRQGLATPSAVEVATQNYIAAEDAIGRWIDECCTLDPGYEAVARLFGSWSAWATRYGEFVGSSKRFSQMLMDRGFEPRRDRHGNGFVGLKVAVVEPPPF